MAKTTTNNKKTTNNKSTVKKKNTYKPKKKYVPKGTTKPKKVFVFEKEKENKIELLDEEELIPYNDELSTIEDEEELIPYNDELSTIDEEREKSLENVIDYYNEEVKKQDNTKEEVPEESNYEKKAPTSAFIITGIVLTIGLSIMVVYLLYKAFSVGDIENIRYTESSNITYTINNTNTIKDEIPSKDFNNITINTDYNYKTNTVSSLKYTYYYLAKIVIIDKETNDELYTKSYQLSDITSKDMIKKNDYSLSNNIDVDYQDYLDKSNKIIQKYDNSKGYLDIYFIIRVNNLSNNEYSLYLEREPFIRLSLTDEVVKPEVTNINTEERVFNRPKVAINKPLRLLEGIILALLTMVILIYTIQLIYDNKKE